MGKPGVSHATTSRTFSTARDSSRQSGQTGWLLRTPLDLRGVPRVSLICRENSVKAGKDEEAMIDDDDVADQRASREVRRGRFASTKLSRVAGGNRTPRLPEPDVNLSVHPALTGRLVVDGRRCQSSAWASRPRESALGSPVCSEPVPDVPPSLSDTAGRRRPVTRARE